MKEKTVIPKNHYVSGAKDIIDGMEVTLTMQHYPLVGGMYVYMTDSHGSEQYCMPLSVYKKWIRKMLKNTSNSFEVLCTREYEKS
jgi:hypothetical protein